MIENYYYRFGTFWTIAVSTPSFPLHTKYSHLLKVNTMPAVQLYIMDTSGQKQLVYCMLFVPHFTLCNSWIFVVFSEPLPSIVDKITLYSFSIQPSSTIPSTSALPWERSSCLCWSKSFLPASGWTSYKATPTRWPQSDTPTASVRSYPPVKEG